MPRRIVLATACENCHTQLSELNEHYDLGVRVEFLSNLVANSLLQGRDRDVTRSS